MSATLSPEPGHACSEATDCVVEGGSYRIAFPPGPDGATPFSAPGDAGRPILVFLHGWQDTAAGMMNNEAVREAARRLGAILVTPDGAERTWSFPGSPSAHRDEFAFLSAVLDDLDARFDRTAAPLVMSGFSMGGSMAWFAGCRLGDRIDGIVAIAGAYWDPVPEDCPTAMPPLVHVHGTADGVVPMEGRPIREVFRQSDVKASIASLFAEACPGEPAPALAGLGCERYAGCGTEDAAVTLCLHDGGHALRSDWISDGVERVLTLKE